MTGVRRRQNSNSLASRYLAAVECTNTGAAAARALSPPASPWRPKPTISDLRNRPSLALSHSGSLGSAKSPPPSASKTVNTQTTTATTPEQSRSTANYSSSSSRRGSSTTPPRSSFHRGRSFFPATSNDVVVRHDQNSGDDTDLTDGSFSSKGKAQAEREGLFINDSSSIETTSRPSTPELAIEEDNDMARRVTPNFQRIDYNIQEALGRGCGTASSWRERLDGNNSGRRVSKRSKAFADASWIKKKGAPRQLRTQKSKIPKHPSQQRRQGSALTAHSLRDRALSARSPDQASSSGAPTEIMSNQTGRLLRKDPDQMTDVTGAPTEIITNRAADITRKANSLLQQHQDADENDSMPSDEKLPDVTHHRPQHQWCADDSIASSGKASVGSWKNKPISIASSDVFEGVMSPGSTKDRNSYEPTRKIAAKKKKWPTVHRQTSDLSSMVSGLTSADSEGKRIKPPDSNDSLQIGRLANHVGQRNELLSPIVKASDGSFQDRSVSSSIGVETGWTVGSPLKQKEEPRWVRQRREMERERANTEPAEPAEPLSPPREHRIHLPHGNGISLPPVSDSAAQPVNLSARPTSLTNGTSQRLPLFPDFRARHDASPTKSSSTGSSNPFVVRYTEKGNSRTIGMNQFRTVSPQSSSSGWTPAPLSTNGSEILKMAASETIMRREIHNEVRSSKDLGDSSHRSEFQTQLGRSPSDKKNMSGKVSARGPFPRTFPIERVTALGDKPGDVLASTTRDANTAAPAASNIASRGATGDGAQPQEKFRPVTPTPHDSLTNVVSNAGVSRWQASRRKESWPPRSEGGREMEGRRTGDRGVTQYDMNNGENVQDLATDLRNKYAAAADERGTQATPRLARPTTYQSSAAGSLPRNHISEATHEKTGSAADRFRPDTSKALPGSTASSLSLHRQTFASPSSPYAIPSSEWKRISSEPEGHYNADQNTASRSYMSEGRSPLTTRNPASGSEVSSMDARAFSSVRDRIRALNTRRQRVDTTPETAAQQISPVAATIPPAPTPSTSTTRAGSPHAHSPPIHEREKRQLQTTSPEVDGRVHLQRSFGHKSNSEDISGTHSSYATPASGHNFTLARPEPNSIVHASRKKPLHADPFVEPSVREEEAPKKARRLISGEATASSRRLFMGSSLYSQDHALESIINDGQRRQTGINMQDKESMRVNNGKKDSDSLSVDVKSIRSIFEDSGEDQNSPDDDDQTTGGMSVDSIRSLYESQQIDGEDTVDGSDGTSGSVKRMRAVFEHAEKVPVSGNEFAGNDSVKQAWTKFETGTKRSPFSSGGDRFSATRWTNPRQVAIPLSAAESARSHEYSNRAVEEESGDVVIKSENGNRAQQTVQPSVEDNTSGPEHHVSVAERALAFSRRRRLQRQDAYDSGRFAGPSKGLSPLRPSNSELKRDPARSAIFRASSRTPGVSSYQDHPDDEDSAGRRSLSGQRTHEIGNRPTTTGTPKTRASNRRQSPLHEQTDMDRHILPLSHKTPSTSLEREQQATEGTEQVAKPTSRAADGGEVLSSTLVTKHGAHASETHPVKGKTRAKSPAFNSVQNRMHNVSSPLMPTNNADKQSKEPFGTSEEQPLAGSQNMSSAKGEERHSISSESDSLSKDSSGPGVIGIRRRTITDMDPEKGFQPSEILQGRNLGIGSQLSSKERPTMSKDQKDLSGRNFLPPELQVANGRSFGDSTKSSEFDDGVTLDLSIAEVSGLTTPTCIRSKEGANSSTSDESCDDSSVGRVAGLAENEGRGPSETSSSQTSEAAAPLIARMNFSSSDGNDAPGVLFAPKAGNGGASKNEQWDSLPSKKSLPVSTARGERVDDDEAWNFRKLDASFPDKKSHADQLFDINSVPSSEWQQFQSNNWNDWKPPSSNDSFSRPFADVKSEKTLEVGDSKEGRSPSTRSATKKFSPSFKIRNTPVKQTPPQSRSDDRAAQMHSHGSARGREASSAGAYRGVTLQPPPASTRDAFSRTHPRNRREGGARVAAQANTKPVATGTSRRPTQRSNTVTESSSPGVPGKRQLLTPQKYARTIRETRSNAVLPAPQGQSTSPPPKHAVLMSRLRSMKEARMRRTAAANSRTAPKQEGGPRMRDRVTVATNRFLGSAAPPLAPSSRRSFMYQKVQPSQRSDFGGAGTRNTYVERRQDYHGSSTPPVALDDEYSASTRSSTHFGGHTFEQNLELD